MRTPTTAHTYRIPAILTLIAIAAILAFSAVITVSAQSDDPEWKLPVTGLTVTTGEASGDLDITWNHHPQTTKTFLNYRVAWTPEGEGFKSADQTDWNAHPTSNQHTVTGLDAGATYQVKVRTRYEGRQGSRWTNVVTGQSGTPEWKLPVTGLTVTTGDDAGELLIAWDHHAQTTKTFLNYRVAWAPQGEGFKSADQTDWNIFTTSNQHTADGLDAGATYQVKVRTRYEGNQGSRWTDVVTGQSGTPTNTTPANAPATGQPTIAGTPEVGETLTLATSSISDDNGLTDANFAYQWIRSADGTNTQIPGATGSTYLISDEDLGHSIKIQVSFTDDDGYSETLTSEATATVPEPTSQNNAATGQPTVSGTAEIGETLTAETSAISDDNGLTNATFNYQWVRSANGTDTNISGATASSHLLSADDLAHTIKVQVSFTDDDGYSETLTSQATDVVVTTPNVAATGQPTIAGTTEVGETLTAGTSAIADANGLTNAVFSHQWVRSSNGTDTNISGATGSTYVVTNADVDAAIKVRVSFTDDEGHSETLTSNATTTVPVPAPVIVPPEEPQIAQASHDGLVSNTGQTTTTTAAIIVGSSLGNKHSQAQQFTTGDNEDGYKLSSVQIYIRDFGGSDAARVSIYEADSSGKPSGSLYPLMNPGSVSNNSLNTFTAPANATLAKETKYLVVAEATSGSYQIGYTSSNAEDSGKANGWSINNRRHTRDSDSGSWSLSSVGSTNIRISVSGTITPSTDIMVPDTWSLIPTGKGVGDKFRLIFLSSTKRNATSSSIGTYNTWIQTRAAAGHMALDDYSDLFKAVGCTDAVDARDNTGTTGTGVSIYWLNGNKVADNYADFYDETWDDESNDKNESGSNGPDTSDSDNYPFTGCDHDGTKASASGTSRALGSGGNVRVGRPNSSDSGNGPIGSIHAVNTDIGGTRPMYGLSPVFIVVELSDDAKLSALAIEGATNGESISLSPGFTANRGNYTATVPNNIDAVSLTATKNESNATVAITDDDDANTKNQADLDLIVGDTTLTVTVTAQDGSTKTYTITVTRTTTITLVSNTGQTRSNESGAVQSQPFTTGSNLGGYTLTSVDVGFQGDNVRTRLFHIVPNQGNGEPNLSDPTKFITLTTPRTTTADKIHTFAAPADARLAANTTYHLLLANSDGGVPGNIHRVSSQAEDDGGAPGWSIGNKRYWRNGNTGPWSDDTANIVRMQINGRNALPSTDATLSTLVIEGATSGESITLSPAFAAGTLTYTAAVPNGIAVITLTAATTHSGAIIAITGDDDANTKNTAILDLSVGANTLTLTVTAEDTSVTETYTITVTRERDPTESVSVPIDWSLIPSGISSGDQFRLLFLSGTRRDGSSSAITDYNTFVQGRAAAGHTDIQAYSDRFMAVGCTEAVDARDNTATTYTSSDKGVPIYWLDGNKVADEYEDFYDGDWDDESNDKNEDGNNGPNTSDSANYPLTGCSDDGTEKISATVSSALGNSGDVTVARPNSTGAGHGPLSSGQEITETFTRPMYGLSAVFTVEDSADATLSNISIEGTADGQTVVLSPDFDDDTLTYTARVGHGIDEVTLTATKSDSNATVVITGDDHASTPDTADFDLSVGPNTLVITVTAMDTTATLTYTITVTRADSDSEILVPGDWSLIPSGLGAGASFRLLFLSSTRHDASSASIDTYNDFVQGRAANGHIAIQAYSDGFTVVGCTQAVDARDNTRTTFTSSEKGIPIYWLNGNKVADEYEDFYDGSWDDEANDKNQSGNNGPDTSDNEYYPLTGCDHNGTEKLNSALGSSGVTVARPNSTDSGHGPLSSGFQLTATNTRPMYGLSAVFTVMEPADCPTDTTWCATMGVRNTTTTTSIAKYEFSGYNITDSNGTLSSTTFSHGSTDYTINRLEQTTFTTLPANTISLRNFYLKAEPALPAGTILTLGDRSFTVGVESENPTAGQEEWDTIDNPLNWTNRQEVTVSLKIPPDATLSNIEIEGTADGQTVVLSPAFDDDTLTYTARVGNGIDEVTLTATKNDSNATVVITNDDNASTKNEADLGLSVGPNTLVITVTAEDTATTLTYTITVARAGDGDPTVPFAVPETWGIIPAGLSPGDQFRLIFGTSGTRDATATAIGTYNTFVQDAAAAGHTDIRAYSSGFWVVGSTADTDARDNTGTTFTSSDKGVPIYWLGGTKVADDYEDFYDGSWDDEVNTLDESGSTVNLLSTSSPFTGTYHDGTERTYSGSSLGLGAPYVTVARLNNTDGTRGPIYSSDFYQNTQTRPVYGLSAVFIVDAPTVPDAPTNLIASADGSSQIDLEWTAPNQSGGAAIAGYKIQHSPNGTSDWTNLVADTGDTDTAYSHTGLNPQTTGYYRVFAINSVGTSDASNVANATTDAAAPPAQVTGVNITPRNGALSVTWTTVSDATGYKVRWKSSGQSYNTSDREDLITSGSTTNYVISGLNNGTQYTVRVVATKTGADDGPPSVERTGTPSDILPTVSFGPGSFTASENGATARVTVEISVPADVTIPLRVQHRGGASSADYSGVPRRLIFADGTTTRSFTVTAVDDPDNDDGEKLRIEFKDLPAGVQTGTRSAVTVKLKDNDGGNSLPLFDPANELRNLVENTAPNQDVGLPITATDADGDSLSYTFDGPDMDRFTFVPATAQLRTKSGQTYDYETHQLFVIQVTADDGNGGTKTATVVIRVRDVEEPPQAPTGLMLEQAYPTSMALSWTEPDNFGRPAITGYDLQFKKSNESAWTAGPQGLTDTSDSITGLDPSTSYHVQVRANNDDGNGPWSSTLSRSTPSSSPGISITKTNLTVTEGDQTGRIYLIVLGSQPTADVHVYISGYDATTVAPHNRSKTFNTGNWNAPRQVLLRTIEDADTTDETVTITHRVESDDTDYEGITVPDLTVNVIDNDTPQVTGVWTQPGDRQLVVNWTATDKATGYKVQWKAPGDNYNTYARMATITSGSTTTYTIPNLTNGTEYTVLVTATWTGHSDGPRSDEATGTPTATP